MKKAILFTAVMAIIWIVFSGVVLHHIFAEWYVSFISFTGGIVVGMVSMMYGLYKWVG